MAPVKKRRSSILRILSLLLVVGGVAGFCFFVLLPSRGAWVKSRALFQALANARSVKIVEFERMWIGPELVFSQVAASPAQIASLRAATGSWFAPGPPFMTMCFKPHHRVEIVRADGSEFHFEVCFLCQNFVLGEGVAM